MKAKIWDGNFLLCGRPHRPESPPAGCVPGALGKEQKLRRPVVRSWTRAATIGLVPNPAVFGYPRPRAAARRRALGRKYSALFYVFSDTLTSPPLLPQWPSDGN